MKYRLSVMNYKMRWNRSWHTLLQLQRSHKPPNFTAPIN